MLFSIRGTITYWSLLLSSVGPIPVPVGIRRFDFTQPSAVLPSLVKYIVYVHPLQSAEALTKSPGVHPHSVGA